MFERETFDLEFKEALTDTFLKTVSAFANYNNGKIVFGIADDGEIRGISATRDAMLRIENRINDSIDPRPDYRLRSESAAGKTLIILEVCRGADTPYYYKDKAYKRSDTSTVPVDRQELNRLVLAGLNLNHESSQSSDQNLEFEVLEKKLQDILGIEDLTLDILKSLGLYGKEGYFNVAARLLSDRNDPAVSGIDMVKFGENLNVILFRGTAEGISILSQFDYALEIFERYYQYEEIVGYSREKKELIPKEAFREALANALVHRAWDINGHIQISMYDDRVEISSPGGLPFGMSEENYLNEQLSLLRNPLIASVFSRLQMIEKFGTGVLRIMRQYRESYIKPTFKISSHHIRVTLPLYREMLPDLSEGELLVYETVRESYPMTRDAIDGKTGFDKAKTIRLLNKLLDKGLIKKQGRGPGTSYTLR